MNAQLSTPTREGLVHSLSEAAELEATMSVPSSNACAASTASSVGT
jgi:hypothetical protein